MAPNVAAEKGPIDCGADDDPISWFESSKLAKIASAVRDQVPLGCRPFRLDDVPEYKPDAAFRLRDTVVASTAVEAMGVAVVPACVEDALSAITCSALDGSRLC